MAIETLRAICGCLRVKVVRRALASRPESIIRPHIIKASTSSTLRLGFVPLGDCAPLIMAQELGLFARHGLRVRLQREVGWATIRDKIIYGELEAAHAPAGLVVAASCGLGCIQTPCVSGLILNLHGNAITLSQRLWREGVRHGASFGEYARDAKEPLTLGVVHAYSSHNLVLRNWLRAHGLTPGREVHIVVVPPAQVHANLKGGHLDGYCVGEPWNSLAVLSKSGWCVATSEELAPRHPEKALLVRRDFAERSATQHLALIAALLEACRFCARAENRERLIETLAQPQYVPVPIQALRMGMSGSFDYGHGRVEKNATLHLFAGPGINEPSRDKGEWIVRNLAAHGLLEDASQAPLSQVGEWFREDLFQAALPLANPS